MAVTRQCGVSLVRRTSTVVPPKVTAPASSAYDCLQTINTLAVVSSRPPYWASTTSSAAESACG